MQCDPPDSDTSPSSLRPAMENVIVYFAVNKRIAAKVLAAKTATCLGIIKVPAQP